jgi:hypothetical protein
MEISMAKRPLWYLMLGTVMLGLAVSPAFAQDNGGGEATDSGQNNEGGSTADTGATGGTTANGGEESAGEASTSMGGQSSGDTGEHNCQGGERWNAQSAACEAEAGPGSTQSGPATGQ